MIVVFQRGSGRSINQWAARAPLTTDGGEHVVPAGDRRLAGTAQCQPRVEDRGGHKPHIGGQPGTRRGAVFTRAQDIFHSVQGRDPDAPDHASHPERPLRALLYLHLPLFYS